MDRAPHDVQATYCATLVDQWVRRGVTHAVIAPGSRSTPMALAIVDRSELRVHVVHDERSAAFVALGLGVDGTPALLLCTSGTAAANFFPAVVEANLSDVAMIVLTADRPDELRGVGAPQTIDQVDLYGKHVRWFRDPGVADETEQSLWRELADDAWVHASTGPVQLNLAFREPLIGSPGLLPEPTAPAPVSARAGRSDPVPDIAVERGLIVVGGRSGCTPDEVLTLRAHTGWPIVADPVSELRVLEGVVCVADSVLRHTRFADEHEPDVIVRVGRPAASKVLAQWTHRAATNGAVLLQVGGPGVIDPDHDVTAVCSMVDLLAECTSWSPVPWARGTAEGVTPWADRWALAQTVGDAAIVETLAGFEEITEPTVARTVADHLPAGAVLTVASSMPVRDLEWFGGSNARAHANRGANGIDGVTSTALGLALTGRASFVLIGDLAFVHDSSALVALLERDADLRIVVLDNDGGGIFSFLPQASSLAHDRFEQLFGTPLGVDIVALAAAHGLESRSVQTVDELVEQLAVRGPWVACVPSNRERNVEVHAALHDAVAARLDAEMYC